MAEPKKRATNTRSGNRRSHLAKKAVILTECRKCKASIPSHIVCPKCGFYKNEDVLELERKENEKKERRKKESEAENE